MLSSLLTCTETVRVAASRLTSRKPGDYSSSEEGVISFGSRCDMQLVSHIRAHVAVEAAVIQKIELSKRFARRYGGIIPVIDPDKDLILPAITEVIAEIDIERQITPVCRAISTPLR